MLQIIVENEKGKQLSLTGDENKFQVEKVTGHNPPSASIITSENISHGEEFVHSRVGNRNIVIDLFINGDVEANRLELYQYVQTSRYIKLYLKNRTKNVWIEGYVETCEVDNYTNKTTCQISVLCPDPWLKDFDETVYNMDTVAPLFYFPFYTVEPIPFSEYATIQILNLINKGNIASGMTIEITARGNITNPIIYNRETREYIGLGNPDLPFTMQAGDKVVITTHPNNKRVKLIRNAVETNIFNYLTENSVFLQLASGDNVFTYSADNGNENIGVNFKYYSNYEGI